MTHHLNSPALLAIVLAALFTLAGCQSGSLESVKPTTEREANRLAAQELYDRGRKALDSSDFNGALNVYSQLEARHPFSDQARQAQLESAYAQYRLGAWTSSSASADRFINQYPRHPHVGYAYYVKGLATFGRATDDVGGFLAVDGARRNAGPARESFFAFSRLINQYPNSPWAADAEKRMIFLRERLARHEIYVVRFYLKRRAWLGAAKRAKSIVEEYQGTAVVPEALDAMQNAYQKLGLLDLAEDAQRVKQATYGSGRGRPQRIEEPPEALLPPAADS